MAALTGVTGTVVTIRSRPVILLRGRIDPVASTASIACRILVDSPRRGKARQQSNLRVR